MSRRQFGVAVALCLVGATVALVAAGQPWAQVTVRQPAPLPLTRLALSGRVLAPGAAAGAGVGLAGVVAIAAARSWGRTVVGVLLLLAGVGVTVATPAAGSARVRNSAVLAERVPTVATAGAGTIVRTTAWPAVSAAGGVLIAAAGALTVARGRRWPTMGARFEAPTSVAGPTTGPAAPMRETAQWDALDRGEDPTA